MNSSDYAKNLRLLCSQHSSISEICRSMEINRQQFNKYLSGQIRPNSHNERRICEFFGVSAEELGLAHARFVEAVAAKPYPTQVADAIAGYFTHLAGALPSDNEKLRRYVGYYYAYFYALGFPGRIAKSLIRVTEHEGGFLTKTIERMTASPGRSGESYVFKYAGMLFCLADRLFLVEYETLQRNAICLTILTPAHRSRVTTLPGITMGVSSGPGREPCCVRVEYEYLGRDIDVRQSLKSCGLFLPDSSEIAAGVAERIANTISPTEFGFHACAR